ncbi:MAG: class I SAM-dependent methyltransferase [Prosthecobacter sp.]
MSVAVATLISADPYIRERLDPAPGDSMYLHLSDLRHAMSSVADERALDVLDFGCGGSPYRGLFPNAQYYRADLSGSEGIDYEIKLGDVQEPLPVAGGSFDLVLSSQVLEHVTEPGEYLREARRVLRAGGRLLLTTHGVFEDHGCPYDFQRWTDAGLSRLVNRHGFEIERMSKLTTGPRAVMFLLEQDFPRVSVKSRHGIMLFPLRWVLGGRRRAGWHRWCDTVFANHRVVVKDLSKHRLYIGLGCVARAI